MKRLLTLALFALCGTCRAAGDAGYLAQLQAQAHQLDLAHATPWLRLLHYQPEHIGNGLESTVRFAGFFNAPEGYADPAAELDATLTVFFSDEHKLDEPAQCRFKARYEWLKVQLGFDPARLPQQDCQRYETWAKGINADSLAVVFASNDLNTPATMFGHTLLRVDPPGQSSDERLLSYALNYAAEGIDDNGFTYAYRGIFGGYVGYFSVYPYYEKVKEYAHSEHRDLWEYPLYLSYGETQRLMWHMWELRGAGSQYYFFSQNCSFQLLSLIEAAKPELDLTHRFLYHGLPYTIPIDTLRQLRDQGVLGEPVYRPASAKRFQSHLEQLTPPQQRWVMDYSRGKAAMSDALYTQAGDRDRARMLETVHEQIFFLFQEGDIKRDDAIPLDRPALLERSHITTPADFAPLPRPQFTPDQGHASGRFAGGMRTDDKDAAMLLRLRPSYHDRLDPPAGFLTGGEIEFFDTELLAGKRGLKFGSFRVVSVQAVAPRDIAFHPWSWQASGGARRLDLQARSAIPGGRTGGYADGGGGMTVAPWSGAQLYGFGFASFDANADAPKGYVLRAGLRAGVAAQWSPRFMQQLEYDELAGASAHSHGLSEVRLGTQWQLLAEQGLRLNLRYTDVGGASVRGGELLWQWYF